MFMNFQKLRYSNMSVQQYLNVMEIRGSLVELTAARVLGQDPPRVYERILETITTHIVTSAGTILAVPMAQAFLEKGRFLLYKVVVL